MVLPWKRVCDVQDKGVIVRALCGVRLMTRRALHLM